MRLEVKNLSFSYEDNAILNGISLQVANREFVGIVGPNGCGKSTFLKLLYKSLIPHSGQISVGDERLEDISSLSRREVARRIAVIPQELDASFGFTSWDIVAMGRSPHMKGFADLRASDHKIIDEALALTGARKYAQREFSSLSGGEKKRVMISRAIAQATPIMLLDEPTNHLDVAAMYAVMEVVRSLGITVVCVLHDLNLAMEYCDRVLVLRCGKVFCDDRPDQVFTHDNVREVFEVESCVRPAPDGASKRIVFAPKQCGDVCNCQQ